METKKKLSLILTACAITGMFAGCGSNTQKEQKLQSTIDSLQQVIGSMHAPAHAGKKERSAPITNELANQYINAYRQANSSGMSEAWLFDKEDMLYLHDNCEYGIRFYAGINNDGHLTLIAVPVDGSKNDVTGKAYDFAEICPNACSAENDINKPSARSHPAKK